MKQSDEVLEFIKRRFGDYDSNWKNGNCYYFAIILKDRFPKGKIYYDIIYGHFIFKYNNKFYDWSGIYKYSEEFLISWDGFEKYDSLLKERIIRDCII